MRMLVDRNRCARALITLLVGLAVSLAGCGDGDGDEADAPTTERTILSTVTTATSTTTTTTASTTTTDAGEQTVQIFFSVGDGSDCSLIAEFDRAVGGGSDPVEVAFDQLVAGPTEEEVAAGAASFFSSATTDAVVSIALTDGLLVIDFTDLRSLIPNASTSCGSAALRAQLDATAFQFPTVERVRYQMDGSCDLFANWLQGECFDIGRNGEEIVVQTNERASGSGCVPPPGDGLPDGRWFGFVSDPADQQVPFDLACWFTGEAAVAAAREDGEESPPPNDYYIRNASDRLRTLAVSATADVAWLPEPGDPASLAVITYADWLDERSGRTFQPGVWLTVADGSIVLIEEQYVP